MKRRSCQIALAAVSCALAAIFMNLGINVSVLIVTGYVFGSVSLMLPLTKNFYAGGALAYAATVLLCLPFGGIALFYKLFPFVVFFGLHPLVNALQEKFRLNRWVMLAVKAVWLDATLCCTWLLTVVMAGGLELPFAWMRDWIYLILVVFGTVVIFPYDWVMIRFQKAMRYYVAKIERGRGADSPTVPRKDEDDIDVFGLNETPHSVQENTKKEDSAEKDKQDGPQEEEDKSEGGEH